MSEGIRKVIAVFTSPLGQQTRALHKKFSAEHLHGGPTSHLDVGYSIVIVPQEVEQGIMERRGQKALTRHILTGNTQGEPFPPPPAA